MTTTSCTRLFSQRTVKLCGEGKCRMFLDLNAPLLLSAPKKNAVLIKVTDDAAADTNRLEDGGMVAECSVKHISSARTLNLLEQLAGDQASFFLLKIIPCINQTRSMSYDAIILFVIDLCSLQRPMIENSP